MEFPSWLRSWWESRSPSASRKRRHAEQFRKRVVPLHLEQLEDRTMLSVVPWTGPATGGDWGTPSNWGGGVLPGAGDTAVIGAGNTVTFSTSDISRVAALEIDGTLNVTGGNLTIGNTAGSNFTVTTSGTVSGAGNINVNNGAANTWSGGTMTGTGTTTFTSGSTWTLSGTDVLAGGWTLGGAAPPR